MARSATLAIRIVSDASQASRGFGEAESRVAGFQRGLDKASVAAGGVLAGIGAAGKAAFDAASKLEQSTGAINSVFGDWALDIEQEAAKAAQALGLSASAYQESAALIGSQLKTMGYDSGDAVAGVKSLTAQAADLAATFGGSTEEAIQAVSSALKGERDPIERYGISLTQAAVDAQVAAMGLDTSTDASKRNAQAQATLALIANQGAAAQGAFSREADTAAGAQQRAAAEFENAKASLGEILLPVVAQAATRFGELAGWLVENKDTVLPLIGVVAGLAGGIIALNGAMRAYSTVQTIVNAVINASPLMRLVLIITGIIAVVVTMYQKFDWFRSIVDTIGSALKTAFNGARSAISWVIDKLSWIKDAGSAVAGLFSAPQTMTVTPVIGPAAGMSGLYGAPAGLYGAAASGGAAPVSGGSMPAPAGDVYHFTINGVLDADDAAEKITRLLERRARHTGRAVVARL